METIALRNGVEMPLLGYGVLQMKEPRQCEKCVQAALESGYRMFDTAASYGNEEPVGRALKKYMDEGKVRREELFVITKLWIDDAREDSAGKAFETSLAKLGLDYIDLYLVHQPYGDYYGAWRAMEKLYEEGRISSAGWTWGTARSWTTGTPVLPGCSFQKKDIQDKDQIYKRRVSRRQDGCGVGRSFLFCGKALPGSLAYVILFVQKPAGRYLKFYYFPLDFLSSFSFTEP